MENSAGTTILVWCVRVLSFAILILTLYATVNIIRSIWFGFWFSWSNSSQEGTDLPMANKYDLRWSSCFTVVSLLSFILFQIIGLKDLSWWVLGCAFVFGFFSWGNYKILNRERERVMERNFHILTL